MARVLLENIYKKYPNAESYTVNNLSLEIKDKEFMIFVGPSGCGKSTVLRMIAGLEKITDGKLSIGDKIVNNLPGAQRDIAMVFQNYALYPHMTVEENMGFALKMRGEPGNIIRQKVLAAAKNLNLDNLLTRTPAQMSGGQCQRVAIGRAIVRQPKVFLMDEPLSNLDAKLRVKMRTEISKLHQDLETTFIYVTHDQVEAMTMGTRIAIMDGGIIQQCDAPETIYERPLNIFVAGFIGSPSMNFFDCLVNAEGNDLFLEKENLFKIKIPDNKKEKVISYKGKTVVLGVRPEHIHHKLSKSIEITKNNSFKAKAIVIEPLGSEKFVLFEHEGSEFTAKFGPKVKLKAKEVTEIAFDMNEAHVFDKASELNITL